MGYVACPIHSHTPGSMEINNAGAASNVVNATMQTFEQEVFNASVDQLVMVDFWAEWCGPCQNLGPILDKLAAEYQGIVKLVKVDTDKEQELAGQFGIRSLPTVVFMKDKQVIDHFMGVLPESEIRQKIEALTANPVDAECDAFEAMHEQGETEQATELMVQLMQKYPDNQRPRLTLVEWLSKSGAMEDAQAIADSLSEEGKKSPVYKAFMAKQEMGDSLDDLPSVAELEASIASDESNILARYQLAQQLMANESYTEAMDHLLVIIAKDREFEDDGARKLMIKVFELLGGSGEVVNAYRSKLSRTLF